MITLHLSKTPHKYLSYALICIVSLGLSQLKFLFCIRSTRQSFKLAHIAMCINHVQMYLFLHTKNCYLTDFTLGLSNNWALHKSPAQLSPSWNRKESTDSTTSINIMLRKQSQVVWVSENEGSNERGVRRTPRLKLQHSLSQSHLCAPPGGGFGLHSLQIRKQVK